MQEYHKLAQEKLSKPITATTFNQPPTTSKPPGTTSTTTTTTTTTKTSTKPSLNVSSDITKGGVILDIPSVEVREATEKRHQERSKQEHLDPPSLQFSSKIRDSHVNVEWHRFF